MIRLPSAMTHSTDEIYSSGDELAAKVRKPYTITKQRERWTEEEHQKFLEALKLYGRAWRRIEEHIGTKTAVQTRSHAQKFFSKLVRESSGRGVSSVGQALDIEIPPPRPKRKPRHPYPRKAGTALQSGSSTIEEGDMSPPPVSYRPELSPGDGTHKSAGFAPCNERENPFDNISSQEAKVERTSINTPPSIFKLFGQTMIVSTAQTTTGAPVKPLVSNDSQGAFREFASPERETVSPENTEDKEHRLENGKEMQQALGPTLQMKLVPKSRKYSGSAFNAAMTSEPGTGIPVACGLSDADQKHAEKEDSGERSPAGLDANSNYLPRKQEAPNVVTGYPRHVPVQCVVDGMVAENIHEFAKSWPTLTSLVHQSSAMNMPGGNSPFLDADIMNSLPSRLPPVFPWMQMQQRDATAAGAAAAATVATASAWWSLYGTVPSPFICPAIYAVASPSFTCNAEHGAREQKKMNMAEREGEILESAVPINPYMDTQRKSASFQKPSDAKSLMLESFDHADCMSQGSQSENYTPSRRGDSNDTEERVENQSCETEEQELMMKDRQLSKERSSSGSNTPSSHEPEMDPYLWTSTEENMGDYAEDFQFGGGRCVSEAEEDACNEKEEAKGCNNPSMKQDEVMGKAGIHIYKDRHNSRSKSGGHFNDTWKEVSDEGRFVFQALFSGEVLPQSFSLPNNFGDGMHPKVDTVESLYKDTKQSLSKVCEDKVELEVPGSLARHDETCTSNGHTYSPKISSATVEYSETTISVKSQESAARNSSLPTTECAAVKLHEATKFRDTASFGHCTSGGAGFVPYQRCSMQANKNRLHSRSLEDCEDDLREGKRKSSRQ